MNEVLTWDASCLHHFAQAERMDVLGHLAMPYRNVTTRVVMAELARHRLDVPVTTSGWLEVVPLDDLAELTAYVGWAARLGLTDARHAGEATVLAWAQVHKAVALLDDADARRQASRAGQRVHGSLWVLAQALRSGRETEGSLAGLLRRERDTGARYPAAAVSDFARWAATAGLLHEGTA